MYWFSDKEFDFLSFIDKHFLMFSYKILNIVFAVKITCNEIDFIAGFRKILK